MTEGGRKRASLLYEVAPEAYEIFKTSLGTGDEGDYAKAKDALTKHFEPAKNAIYDIRDFC